MDLKTLCDLFGTSGDEKEVRRAISEEARQKADAVTVDRAGNVIAFKRGTDSSAPRVLLCAHMDEVGFIIMDATEEGLLRFAAIGGIDPRVCVSKHVVVGKDRVPGIIGAMAIHLQTAEDRKRVLKMDGLYIDIGANSKEEALKCCPKGSYAYFNTQLQEFGDGCVVGKALDDRVGCRNLLELMENRYPCDVTYAFVCQEEIGSRGALGAAFDADADVALILEGTAAGDLGEVPETRRVIRVGEGVGVSFMDLTSLGDVETFNRLLDLGKAFEVPVQIKNGVTGGNDARAFRQVKGGTKTCVLSVPCRYIHGPSSVAKLSDIDAQRDLVRVYLENI